MKEIKSNYLAVHRLKLKNDPALNEKYKERKKREN